MAARVWVLSLFVGWALAGCAEYSAIAAAIASSERWERSIAARFDLDVDVSCTPEGEPHFAPCSGELELVFTNTGTGQSARGRVSDGDLGGALPVGDYEIALVIDGMQVGLSSAHHLGLVPLRDGLHALGTLHVRFVELRPGTFTEQAIHAERARAAFGLTAVDLLHSPERGLLLVEARLEGPET